jgi:hypothetical protein
MSLARTALRLAGIHALLQDPVIGKLCAGRVYDSRIEPFDAREPVPVIIVMTEEMKGRAWSDNNGGPPFDAHCELAIEIAMTAVSTVEDPDNPTQALELYAPVATARESEAVLDLLEERAVEALTVADGAASELLRREVVRRASEIHSRRFVDAESSVKLAVRQIALTVELKGEDQRDARIVPTGPYANLPNPLRAVCEAMPDGSSAALVCKYLNDIYVPDPVEMLAGVDATYAPQQNLDPDATPIPPDQTGSHPTFERRIDIPT